MQLSICAGVCMSRDEWVPDGRDGPVYAHATFVPQRLALLASTIGSTDVTVTDTVLFFTDCRSLF